MTDLVVEDGTGLANADAYVSLEGFEAYAVAKSWTIADAITDDQKNQAIRDATTYLDSTFQWKGTLKSKTQSLGWPRDCATDKEGRDLTGLPAKVVQACNELAFMALSAPLLASITDASIKSVTAGPVRVEYAVGSKPIEADKVQWINRLLNGLMEGTSGIGPNVALSKA